MTISLEEHVARAIDIAQLKYHKSPVLEFAMEALAADPNLPASDISIFYALAAIAAVREWEVSERLPSSQLMESAARFSTELASNGGNRDKAVAATRECMDALGLTPRRIEGRVVDPAEAMRAKCEKIAQNELARTGGIVGEQIVAAIAALKGNGEGRA